MIDRDWPVENDLAAEVLRSADEAFARVMGAVPERAETMPPELEAADALRWAGDRVTELLAGLAELPLDRLVGLVDGPVAGGDRKRRRAAAASPVPRGEPLLLRAAPGSVAETRVWAHLIGQPPAATLRFVLTDLVGPDGERLAGGEAVFTPAELAVPRPAAAAWTLLRMSIPAAASSGEYHGLIIGRGVAGAVVPIMVVIT